MNTNLSTPVIYFPPKSTVIKQAVLFFLGAGASGFWFLSLGLSSEPPPLGTALQAFLSFFIFLPCFLMGCGLVWRCFVPVPSVRIDSWGIWSAAGGSDLSLVLWNEILAMRIRDDVLRIEFNDGAARILPDDSVPISLEALLGRIEELKAFHEHRSPEPVTYYGKGSLNRPPTLRVDASGLLIKTGMGEKEFKQVPWIKIISAEVRTTYTRQGAKWTWLELHLKGGAKHEFSYRDLSVDPKSALKQIEMLRGAAALPVTP